MSEPVVIAIETTVRLVYSDGAVVAVQQPLTDIQRLSVVSPDAAMLSAVKEQFAAIVRELTQKKSTGIHKLKLVGEYSPPARKAEKQKEHDENRGQHTASS